MSVYEPSLFVYRGYFVHPFRKEWWGDKYTTETEAISVLRFETEILRLKEQHKENQGGN